MPSDTEIRLLVGAVITVAAIVAGVTVVCGIIAWKHRPRLDADENALLDLLRAELSVDEVHAELTRRSFSSGVLSVTRVDQRDDGWRSLSAEYRRTDGRFTIEIKVNRRERWYYADWKFVFAAGPIRSSSAGYRTRRARRLP